MIAKEIFINQKILTRIFKKIKARFCLIEPLYDQWKDVKEDPKYDILINNLKNNLFKKPFKFRW